MEERQTPAGCPQGRVEIQTLLCVLETHMVWTEQVGGREVLEGPQTKMASVASSHFTLLQNLQREGLKTCRWHNSLNITVLCSDHHILTFLEEMKTTVFHS